MMSERSTNYRVFSTTAGGRMLAGVRGGGDRRAFGSRDRTGLVYLGSSFLIGWNVAATAVRRLTTGWLLLTSRCGRGSTPAGHGSTTKISTVLDERRF